MNWNFQLTRPDGSGVGALTRLTSMKITWNLDDLCHADFGISGYAAEAANIAEMSTDLVAVCNGQTLFRGRCGTSTDEIDEDKHEITFTAQDYRGLLQGRLIRTALSYSAQYQQDIAWDLINRAQQQTYGDMLIRQGIGFPSPGSPAQPQRDRTYVIGKPVGETIAELGRCQNGFDWEIDSLLKLNIYYPQRGQSRPDTVLEYGRNVNKVRRQWQSESYGNGIISTGASTVAPVYVEQAGPLPSGRIERAISDPSATLAQTLTDRANGALAVATQPLANYELTMRPDTYTPTALWLGDSCTVSVESGRLAFVTTVRILRIEIDVQPDGGEVVTLSAGRIVQRAEERSARTASRIARLEVKG